MKLLVLSKTVCGGCTLLKDFLAREEVKHDVAYVDKDVEVAVKYGVMSAPVTILLDDNDNEVSRVFGYDEEEVKKLIALL